MPQEPDWNWKAVVAGALSNPLFVVGVGASVLFSAMMALPGNLPADEAKLSDEERQQKRAEVLQELEAKSEAAKHDPKKQRFNKRFKVGMTVAWCASDVLQGFVAGRVSKKHPMEHAAASYLLTFVVGKATRQGWMRNEFFRDTGLFAHNRSFRNRLPQHALKVASILFGGYLSRQK